MVMKHCPPEFKVEAVALYRSPPDATIKQVAADLWSAANRTAPTEFPGSLRTGA